MPGNSRRLNRLNNLNVGPPFGGPEVPEHLNHLNDLNSVNPIGSARRI